MSNIDVHPMAKASDSTCSSSCESSSSALQLAGSPKSGKVAVRVRQSSAVRHDLVARVKAEIAAGTYETPERIDRTVDRLCEELFPELS